MGGIREPHSPDQFCHDSSRSRSPLALMSALWLRSRGTGEGTTRFPSPRPPRVPHPYGVLKNAQALESHELSSNPSALTSPQSEPKVTWSLLGQGGARCHTRNVWGWIGHERRTVSQKTAEYFNTTAVSESRT